jgi:hypothetical protein
VLVTGKAFQPSLMFVGEARARWGLENHCCSVVKVEKIIKKYHGFAPHALETLF